uniref:MLLT1 super elongation complex subunit a n=1 Tax=Petromyzon marinus TaxID=7757 RepID=S4RWZ7_PETMA
VVQVGPVQVKLELGHRATARRRPTPEGFTHDWCVSVRGPDGAAINHFVEKVVFHLHESFAKPKRVCREPPYKVEESGYAGFILPIEVYFKNKEEPRKVKFDYDLFLHLEGQPPVNHLRCEKLTFSNPPSDFRRRLLKAGGMMVSPDGMAVLSAPPEVPSSSHLEHRKPTASLHVKDFSKPIASLKPPKPFKGHKEKPSESKDYKAPASSDGPSRESVKKAAASRVHKPRDEPQPPPPATPLPKAPSKEPKALYREPPVERISKAKDKLNSTAAAATTTTTAAAISDRQQPDRGVPKPIIPPPSSYRPPSTPISAQSERSFPEPLSVSPSEDEQEPPSAPKSSRCHCPRPSQYVPSVCSRETRSSSPSPPLSSPSPPLSSPSLPLSSHSPPLSSHSSGPVLRRVRSLTELAVLRESLCSNLVQSSKKNSNCENYQKWSCTEHHLREQGCIEKYSDPSHHMMPNSAIVNNTGERRSSDPKPWSCTQEVTSSGLDYDKAYMEELVRLHRRLMMLRERSTLQQVVNLIEETGHFQVTSTTFDFDLFSLDQAIVRKLQSYLGPT